MRVVIDTNVFISRLLLPDSAPARAAKHALDSGIILVSEDTMNELADVLARPELDRYLSLKTRQQFLLELGEIAQVVPIIQRIRVCHDPRDDKFLELAVNGQAKLILTGDRDLHPLHPFPGIAILSPADYLAAA
jgi:putative PIN family toxin of toxin-antitoxin system